jgi:hypothetical protein
MERPRPGAATQFAFTIAGCRKLKCNRHCRVIVIRYLSSIKSSGHSNRSLLSFAKVQGCILLLGSGTGGHDERCS